MCELIVSEFGNFYVTSLTKITKKLIRISFPEDVEPDLVSRSEIRFSGFRLTSLVATMTRVSYF